MLVGMQEEGQVYDAVVVLNGGADKHGVLFTDTKARVLESIALAHRYKIPVIMVGHEAKEMREYALLQGQAAKSLQILVEDHSHNTAENAHFVKTKFLVPKKWRSIIVVTELFHAERAKLTFEMVLGGDYRVRLVGVTAGYSPVQRQELARQEAFYVQLTKDKLGDIPPDDDKKREALFAQKREVTTDYFPAVRI